MIVALTAQQDDQHDLGRQHARHKLEHGIGLGESAAALA